MQTGYLKEFIEIVVTGNFSQAAENLSTTQATLSKHIKSLESELSLTLFDRTTRKVSVTPAGNILFDYATQMIGLEQAFFAQQKELAGKVSRDLCITSIPVMAQYGITNLVAKFRAMNPKINIYLKESENDEVAYRMMKNHECELAFIRSGKADMSRFEYFTYFTDKLISVLPNTHPLSSFESISIAQLSQESFLLLNEKTTLLDLSIDLCKQGDFFPQIIYTGNRPENIIELVSSGAGVSLLMKKHAQYEKCPAVSYVEIIESTVSNIYLTRLKERHLSPSAKLFWEYTKTFING